MNHLDVYYRALSEYRKLTVANQDCTTLRSAIATTDTEQDKIEIKRAFCTIEEDWVEAIEAGLVHVEKAIKQDRQFIRSNGEIIPIEKVKHVSKESVEHLAKHSNLITRYEEGEDIVPDKLYTVERLNDYAVYENRFLYMLLCYLRDFITIRYNDITELTHKYEATISLDKKIATGRGQMTYTLSMHDVRKNDQYLKDHNPARDIIDRIDLILKAVLAFLATPLMEVVSKAPMLKPPITKTNVLKMNNNFKGAVALYDFIIAYDKPGYNTEFEVSTISPFRDDLADEMAEAGGLVSFLAYEYGLKIKNDLKEAYVLEELRLKDEEIRKRAESIAAMKRRLEASGVGIEEYVITLEKQLRALEAERVRAQTLAEEIAELKDIQKRLSKSIEDLKDENENLKVEMAEEKQRHFEEMEALKKAHEDEMHELIVRHEEEIRALNEKHENEIKELTEKHNAEIEELNRKHREEIDSLNEAAARERERYEGEIARIRLDTANEIQAAREDCKAKVDEACRNLSETREQLDECNREKAQLLEQKLQSDARVKALGGVDRDYTDRDSFNLLENEYKAFTRLYKEQWTKTKKQIRTNHLNMKNIRGNEENDKNSD